MVRPYRIVAGLVARSRLVAERATEAATSQGDSGGCLTGDASTAILGSLWPPGKTCRAPALRRRQLSAILPSAAGLVPRGARPLNLPRRRDGQHLAGLEVVARAEAVGALDGGDADAVLLGDPPQGVAGPHPHLPPARAVPAAVAGGDHRPAVPAAVRGADDAGLRAARRRLGG